MLHEAVEVDGMGRDRWDESRCMGWLEVDGMGRDETDLS